MLARIVCVNRGGVRPFAMPRGLRSSAINKQSIDGPVTVRELGLEGDEQFERKFHGGRSKAVHVYAAQDLAWWSEQLAISLTPGFIGENLTTAGIDLNALYPGDRLHIGSVILRVTEPRMPCAKLAARIGIAGFERRFGRALRTGVYCAVDREGSLCGGDAIDVVPGSRTGPSIRDIVATKYCPDGRYVYGDNGSDGSAAHAGKNRP